MISNKNRSRAKFAQVGASDARKNFLTPVQVTWYKEAPSQRGQKLQPNFFGLRMQSDLHLQNEDVGGSNPSSPVYCRGIAQSVERLKKFENICLKSKNFSNEVDFKFHRGMILLSLINSYQEPSRKRKQLFVCVSNGMSASGKPADFDFAIRRFESYHPIFIKRMLGKFTSFGKTRSQVRILSRRIAAV